MSIFNNLIMAFKVALGSVLKMKSFYIMIIFGIAYIIYKLKKDAEHVRN